MNEKETLKANLDTFDGFTIGAGMETRLSMNWGLKLEYCFTQFSGEDLFNIQGPIDEDGEYVIEAGASAELEPSLHTGRLVLTYRFNRAPEPIESFK